MNKMRKVKILLKSKITIKNLSSNISKLESSLVFTYISQRYLQCIGILRKIVQVYHAHNTVPY